MSPSPVASFRRSPSGERAALHFIEMMSAAGTLVSLTYERSTVDAYVAEGALTRPELLALADACHVIEEACELVYPHRVEWLDHADATALVDGQDYSPSLRRMDGYAQLYGSTALEAWDVASAQYEELFGLLTDAWSGPEGESLHWEDGILWLAATGEEA